MAELFFNILVFPGLLFLLVMSFAAEFADRKLYARFQNRVGPPWFQPFADAVKLFGKEDVITNDADPAMFRLMPIFAFAASVTAFLYIPIWSTKTIFSFSGDLIVVLYLLTIPTLAFFLGAWHSNSPFAMVGAIRTLTQLFAYEIPLFLAVLSSALLADSLSLSDIAVFYGKNPSYCLVNIIAFAVSIVAMLGKLEKVPFDIPEAETEIVAGSFTEYSGGLFAFIRMTVNIEMITGAALLSAVFFPLGLDLAPAAGFAIFIVKIFIIIALIALCRTVMARLRIEQMIDLCWRYIAPVAFLQVLLALAVKGVISR